MIELSEFSLGASSSYGQELQGNSQLFRNNIPVPLHLEGSVLRHQFETASGYLFITDHDCPFEEMTHITLCTPDFRLLSRRWLGWPYCSFNLERIEWQDASHMMLEFSPEDRWMLSIRPWGIPYLRPRLGLSRMSGTATAHQAAPDVVVKNTFS